MASSVQRTRTGSVILLYSPLLDGTADAWWRSTNLSTALAHATRAAGGSGAYAASAFCCPSSACEGRAMQSAEADSVGSDAVLPDDADDAGMPADDERREDAAGGCIDAVDPRCDGA